MYLFEGNKENKLFKEYMHFNKDDISHNFYLEGDDISENAYRASSKLPMGFGHGGAIGEISFDRSTLSPKILFLVIWNFY
ncbi:MAG: hypothetical protein LBS23_01075 [Holosporaceae bacterium]|nr:hypothetical protein [Holosporaceae bacterium]